VEGEVEDILVGALYRQFIRGAQVTDITAT
jgi:hypothetical protein